jgi:hypothetical protein
VNPTTELDDSVPLIILCFQIITVYYKFVLKNISLGIGIKTTLPFVPFVVTHGFRIVSCQCCAGRKKKFLRVGNIDKLQIVKVFPNTGLNPAAFPT